MEFRMWYLTLLVLAVLCFILGPEVEKVSPATAIPLQSAFLLVLLVGLPSTFMWFKNRLNRLQAIENVHERIDRYETVARIRQAIFFVFGVLVLAAHVFTPMKGLSPLMLFLVVVLLVLFTVPSRRRLLTETGLLPSLEENVSEEEEGSE
jgi:hypothetical protein